MSKPEPQLTIESPFAPRLAAYLRERFPVVGHGLLVLSYYAAAHAVAAATVRAGAPMELGARHLAGVVVLFLFFFHLRVFDEHKDYGDDSAHHGERMLQRGLITLRHLKLLGGAAIAIEFALAALVGPAAVVALAFAFIYSLLMLREFFVHEWLSRRLVAYAVTHMLVMPLLTAVAFSFATGVHFWRAPPLFWLYAAATFFLGMGLEISRKVRAPGDEIEGVDSYTSVLGTYRAAYTVLWIRAVDVILVSLLAWALGLPCWLLVVLVALYLLTVSAVARFRRDTHSSNAERIESQAALHLLAANLSLAIAVALSSGVDWRWP